MVPPLIGPPLTQAIAVAPCPFGPVGFVVDLAHDGREGLWMATENSYDVIFLDVMLPRLDGNALCARLGRPRSGRPS
jgi:DNA-binding response OmpR family regulator